jgi:hypothetical protein
MTDAPVKSPSAAPVGSRSGSQRRQRSRVWQVAMTPAEFDEARGKAVAAGLTPSSYGRVALLGKAGPRARRVPPENTVVLAQAIAALNRIGNNLNQIARARNAGRPVVAGEESEVLRVTRAAVLRIVALTAESRDP